MSRDRPAFGQITLHTNTHTRTQTHTHKHTHTYTHTQTHTHTNTHTHIHAHTQTHTHKLDPFYVFFPRKSINLTKNRNWKEKMPFKEVIS